MKKVKSITAALLILIGSVFISPNLYAHCIACDGTTEFDGRCFGEDNRQCVDESSWWYSNTCNDGVQSTEDCPDIITPQ